MSVGSRADPALRGGGIQHLLSFFQRGRCGPCLKEQRQRSTILMVGSLYIFPVPFTFPFISSIGVHISLFKRNCTVAGRAVCFCCFPFSKKMWVSLSASDPQAG